MLSFWEHSLTGCKIAHVVENAAAGRQRTKEFVRE